VPNRTRNRARAECPQQAEPWHARSPEQALAALEVGPQGLSAEQAQARLARFGTNRIESHGGPSTLSLITRQFRSPLIYSLLIAAAVAAAFGETEDAVVVLAVVLLNALIGFGQEFRAARAIAALAEMVAEPARVQRDGRWRELPAEEIVPGDLIRVAQGDRVAADARLVRADGLRTSEAALTGESMPSEKGVDPVAVTAPLAERASLLHAGTLVAAGLGDAVVVATGSASELGRVSTMIEQADPLRTPLTLELDHLGRVITLAIGVAAVLLAVAAAVRGFPAGDAVVAAISLAVAAVPEGLPAVVTIALAIGVQRMAGRKAIVRHLPAVETLGSTTVIATDKTGTLTRNRLTVSQSWMPDDEAGELLLAGVLCNDASSSGDWKTSLGDPTEVALLVAGHEGGIDLARARAAHPRLAAIPFDAERRFMATVNRDPDGSSTLYAKGAPEALLPRCHGVDAAAVQAEVDRLTGLGERVLLLAKRERVAPERLQDSLGDLRLLGLQAMIDPPRPGALEAVEACRRAGIRVLMVTGDHPRTAVAIGHGLGFDQAEAMTGAEIATLPENELRARTSTADVYARTDPEHKLRLVRALQSDGQVVAVTGDGVNDAPALRQAAIGVAMGRSGTATTKEAADIVLADDNFATLRAAVEEGRRVYDNLVKALAFVLPTSIGQALIIIGAVLLFPLEAGEPVLPVEPVQILWINLIVAVALALPLALEAPEPDLMERPPRDRRRSLFDLPLLVRTLVVAGTLMVVALGIFEIEYHRHLDAGTADDTALARAQTTAVTAAVLLQALYLITCRSLTRPNREIGRWSNPSIYLGIAAVLALQALFIVTPAMHEIFGSAWLDLQALALAAAAALLILPVTWLEERWRTRRSLSP
jgi:calcium-translocating P-type ATPase